MESNRDLKSAFRSYAAESVKLAVLVGVIFAIGKFIVLVPFMSDFSFMGTMNLVSFINSVLSFLAVVALLGYAVETSSLFGDIFHIFPQAALPYRWGIYALVTVFSHYAFYGFFSAFISSDYMWVYQLFFVGLVIYFSSMIGLYFYKNGKAISQGLLSFFEKTKI